MEWSPTRFDIRLFNNNSSRNIIITALYRQFSLLSTGFPPERKAKKTKKEDSPGGYLVILYLHFPISNRTVYIFNGSSTFAMWYQLINKALFIHYLSFCASLAVLEKVKKNVIVHFLLFQNAAIWSVERTSITQWRGLQRRKSRRFSFVIIWSRNVM